MAYEQKPDMWVAETHKDIIGLRFRVEKTLFSEKSSYQQIDVVKTAGHGNLLLNDGLVMISERDEFVYHEMIAHVPLFVHPNPETVLIIGGGDGGSAREVLKHRSVKRAVMVEIDEMVVTACRRHFPSVSCALDDPRLELLFEDGIRFVKETKDRFDIVIIDSTDPVGPGAVLFARDFYSQVARILTENGIMITQAESPFYDADLQEPMLRNQRSFFKRLHLYLFSNITYPGGLWCFGFASNTRHPLKDFDENRARTAGFQTKYYNPGIHRAAFMLPNFMINGLSGVLDPISDSDGGEGMVS